MRKKHREIPANSAPPMASENLEETSSWPIFGGTLYPERTFASVLKVTRLKV